MSTLYELTADYRRLLELAEENDSQAITDTLESLDGAIEDKVENTVKVIRDLESQVVAKRNEARKFYDSASSLEKQVGRLKDYLQDQLAVAGKKKVQGELFTVTLRNNPASVYVTDEKSLPKQYFTPQPPKLDKNILKLDLKAGKEVEGAELRTRQSLQIK